METRTLRVMLEQLLSSEIRALDEPMHCVGFISISGEGLKGDGDGWTEFHVNAAGCGECVKLVKQHLRNFSGSVTVH